jgi:hypothetical protein
MLADERRFFAAAGFAKLRVLPLFRVFRGFHG